MSEEELAQACEQDAAEVFNQQMDMMKKEYMENRQKYDIYHIVVALVLNDELYEMLRI